MKGKIFIIIITNMNKSYNRLDSLKHLNYFLLWYSCVCVIWNSIFKHTPSIQKKIINLTCSLNMQKKNFFFAHPLFLLMINSCPFMIRSTSSLESNLSMFYFLFFLMFYVKSFEERKNFSFKLFFIVTLFIPRFL